VQIRHVHAGPVLRNFARFDGKIVDVGYLKLVSGDSPALERLVDR